MTNHFLDTSGLLQAMQSVDRRLASEAKSLFKTDPNWEAASLSVLEGWVSNNTATDSINNRTVANYDVYLATDKNVQYYFDSGAWLLFTPDMTDYFTKGESDARYPTMADFADMNLAVSPIVIPSKLAGFRQLVESLLTTPINGLITAVQTTTVSVQFTVGNNTSTSTLPFDGAITNAKVGGLVRIDRKWTRSVQAAAVTYTLDESASRCFSHSAQADWNVTDPASPGFIHNKPTIPAGVEIIDSLESTRTDASLSANKGRELNQKVEAIEPLSTADINTVLVAAGFPAV